MTLYIYYINRIYSIFLRACPEIHIWFFRIWKRGAQTGATSTTMSTTMAGRRWTARLATQRRETIHTKTSPVPLPTLTLEMGEGERRRRTCGPNTTSGRSRMTSMTLRLLRRIMLTRETGVVAGQEQRGARVEERGVAQCSSLLHLPSFSSFSPFPFSHFLHRAVESCSC